MSSQTKAQNWCPKEATQTPLSQMAEPFPSQGRAEGAAATEMLLLTPSPAPLCFHSRLSDGTLATRNYRYHLGVTHRVERSLSEEEEYEE